MFYRRGIGIHAFEVSGSNYLAATYSDDKRQRDRYRYGVLCGGEVAKPGLRTAELDPSDSDEPGATRRIALATYVECEDFLARLTIFIADATRGLNQRSERTDVAEQQLLVGQRTLTAVKRRKATTRAEGAR